MRDENKEVFIPAKDLRECTLPELRAVIFEAQQNLHRLRHRKELTPHLKSHLFKGYKKLIARCKTIFRERSPNK